MYFTPEQLEALAKIAERKRQEQRNRLLLELSMAFSNALAKNETPPTSLDVTATATFVPGEGITTMELTVVGDVAGISEEKFQEPMNR